MQMEMHVLSECHLFPPELLSAVPPRDWLDPPTPQTDASLLSQRGAILLDNKPQ